MTTVAFQGPGWRPAGRRMTLCVSVEARGIRYLFTASGTWRGGLRAAIAQGYDEMKYVGLYHLNAYTYADPTWFPDMDPDLRAMFQKVTKGSLSGKAGGEGDGGFQDQRPVRRHAC